MKDSITNFPKNGDNKEISLKNSQYPEFDFGYASKLKEEYPEIWDMGGNVYGNKAFEYWSQTKKGKIDDEVKKWIKKREGFAARHKIDTRIKGIIANIKWGTIVSKGEKYMKDLVEEEKKKIDNKKRKNKMYNETLFLNEELIFNTNKEVKKVIKEIENIIRKNENKFKDFTIIVLGYEGGLLLNKYTTIIEVFGIKKEFEEGKAMMLQSKNIDIIYTKKYTEKININSSYFETELNKDPYLKKFYNNSKRKYRKYGKFKKYNETLFLDQRGE
jgi:hypothetical protein